MKRMICYFFLCALVLACIAGCISEPPVSTPTGPSGSASLENPSNSQTEPEFTIPTYELEPLPVIDREKAGPLVEYDPDRELYILTGQNDIIYANGWGNNTFVIYIYSKQQLDPESISVEVPISHGYDVRVREIALGGVQLVSETVRMKESYYDADAFTYPLYLAYMGKDFHKLAQLQDEADQLLHLVNKSSSEFGYSDMLHNGEITFEQYELLRSPYTNAEEEYEAYQNAEWEDYLALKRSDLPQFYVYYIGIDFDYFKEVEQEESFTQVEVTIGENTYVQDVGKVTLIEEWELPAPLDWRLDGYNVDDGVLGEGSAPALYNDGIHCVTGLFSFDADRYKLLEELVLLNPAQKVERVWLSITPASGKAFNVEWDMSEPYEIYPGDNVWVYVAYSEESMDTVGYQTVLDAYLLYTTDGESYCKKAHAVTPINQQHYYAYAVLFDGLDLESYYWDYYYRFFEAWRYDPEEDPCPPVW